MGALHTTQSPAWLALFVMRSRVSAIPFLPASLILSEYFFVEFRVCEFV